MPCFLVHTLPFSTPPPPTSDKPAAFQCRICPFHKPAVIHPGSTPPMLCHPAEAVLTSWSPGNCSCYTVQEALEGDRPSSMCCNFLFMAKASFCLLWCYGA